LGASRRQPNRGLGPFQKNLPPAGSCSSRPSTSAMRPVGSPFGTSGQCHIGSNEQIIGAK
jgi:hypothetical protein